MSLAAVKQSSKWEAEPLVIIDLVTHGVSFSEYLAQLGSSSIFDTSTIDDSRGFIARNGKQKVELVAVTGVDLLDFNWPSQFLELGLTLCPYEVAFELLNKHANSGLLSTNYYLAIERGVFILGKNPVFLAESWLKRKWFMSKLGYPWIFCREISQ